MKIHLFHGLLASNEEFGHVIHGLEGMENGSEADALDRRSGQSRRSLSAGRALRRQDSSVGKSQKGGAV